MKKSFLKILILYCLKIIEGQRSIYSILHLLKGKKSAQTIQDAHFFQLTKLFSAFPYLDRADLEDVICDLENGALIHPNSSNSFLLTEAGTRYLNDNLRMNPIPSSLNGWKYHQVAELFWERLSLTIQVISHLNNHDTKYIPIQRKKDIHQWLKVFLQTTALNREALSKKINEEMVNCLEDSKEIDPSILIFRLTGYNTIGFTAAQVAEWKSMDFVFYHIQFMGLIHFMLERIYSNSTEYPILYKLVEISNQIDHDLLPITLSAKKTYKFLTKGLMIDDIVRVRGLKRSTIEDHIVEIALNLKDFDISPFVSQEKQNLIKAAVRGSISKQLRQIRLQVPSADYFDIRLTLTRVGDSK